MEEQNKIVAERREKLAALREKGVGYPNDFTRTHLSQELESAHGGKSKEELEKNPIQATIAGRLMLKRVMGKASFGVLQDHAGRLQIYVSDDRTGKDTHAQFKHFDLGDIVGASGVLFRTQKGELTLQAHELRLLTKSLRPLPEKFHGLTDQEQRY